MNTNDMPVQFAGDEPKAGDLLALAQQCGATVYRHRMTPQSPALAFGDDAWAKFCQAVESRQQQEPAMRVWMDEHGRLQMTNTKELNLTVGRPLYLYEGAAPAPQQAEAVPPDVVRDAERLRGLHRMTCLIDTPVGDAYQRAMEDEMKKVYDALCGDLSKSTIEQYRQVLDAGLDAAAIARQKGQP